MRPEECKAHLQKVASTSVRHNSAQKIAGVCGIPAPGTETDVTSPVSLPGYEICVRDC